MSQVKQLANGLKPRGPSCSFSVLVSWHAKSLGLRETKSIGSRLHGTLPSLFAPNTISLRMDLCLTMSCSSLSLLFLISLHIQFLAPAYGEFWPFLDCDPYNCRGQEISYPFRHKDRPNHCEFPGYELGCDGDHPTLSMESLEYRVIHINMSTQILKVARIDLSDDICLGTHVNTTLDFSLFNSTSGDHNSALFYGCNSSLTPGFFQFSCPASGDGYFTLHLDPANPPHEPCNFSVLVPISPIAAPGVLPPPLEGGDDSAPNIRAIISEVLNQGFEISWIADTSQCKNCTESGGRCGYGWRRQQFDCFCPDGVYSATCEQSTYAYPHLKFRIRDK